MSEWLITQDVASRLNTSRQCIDYYRKVCKLDARKEMRKIETSSKLGKLFFINKPVWVYSPESVKELQYERHS